MNGLGFSLVPLGSCIGGKAVSSRGSRGMGEGGAEKQRKVGKGRGGVGRKVEGQRYVTEFESSLVTLKN